MGFTVLVWDAVRCQVHRDELWDGAKFTGQDEFFGLVSGICTHIKREDEYSLGDGAHCEYRPNSQDESETLRAAVRRTMAEHPNRSRFLHLVDVAAKNPAIWFVPSY